ncbi:hypothetical protein [Wohlfahrtiimonas larvae]|uniref:Uncharacterized protein n=1 Tax=Wohlfahrtiimonas larvae TaxID=1157986 RepID=A0ABP9MQI5_9GAMM|nr:hypothetical protein [Wohlfahrtiimonas larvae]
MKLQQITLVETARSYDVKAKALGKSIHAEYIRAFKTRGEAEKHIEALNTDNNICQNENKRWLKNLKKYGGSL